MLDHRWRFPAGPLRSVSVTAVALVCWFPVADAAVALDNDALIERVDPAVVQILNTRATGPPGLGSGFVLNADGDIATNHHVVEGWRLLEVKQGERSYAAELVWASESLDLAVIRVQSGSFGVLSLALPEPNPLQAVVAFGHPGVSASDREPTRTPGTVNKRVYRGSWGAGDLRLIEHSAPVNPGNSGGPLVDRCGRAVGVNTQAPLVRLAPDLQVMRASGVYWSSHIAELAVQLDLLGVVYQSATDRCEGPPATTAGASREELADLRREIEEQQRRAEAEDAYERAAAQARVADLQRELDEAVAAQEAGAASYAETRSEIADLRDDFSKHWMSGLAMVGGALLLLALVAFAAFASFRRTVLLAAGRLRDGTSSMVRSRGASPRVAASVKLPDAVRIRVGRSADMDVMLDSRKVSRFHAELKAVSGGYRLTDRGSTNGTRVFRGGRWREISTGVVRDDERLELGDYRTTAAELARIVAADPTWGGEGERETRPEDRPAGPVKRDRRTGEIVQD